MRKSEESPALLKLTALTYSEQCNMVFEAASQPEAARLLP